MARSLEFPHWIQQRQTPAAHWPGEEGRLEDPGLEEETGVQSEQRWAQHLLGPGSAWGAVIDCAPGPAKGEAHHITLHLQSTLMPLGPLPESPGSAKVTSCVNCIKCLDRRVSILKLDFLSD